jgi:hypothetical protein
MCVYPLMTSLLPTDTAVEEVPPVARVLQHTVQQRVARPRRVPYLLPAVWGSKDVLAFRRELLRVCEVRKSIRGAPQFSVSSWLPRKVSVYVCVTVFRMLISH